MPETQNDKKLQEINESINTYQDKLKSNPKDKDAQKNLKKLNKLRELIVQYKKIDNNLDTIKSEQKTKENEILREYNEIIKKSKIFMIN